MQGVRADLCDIVTLLIFFWHANKHLLLGDEKEKSERKAMNKAM